MAISPTGFYTENGKKKPITKGKVSTKIHVGGQGKCYEQAAKLFLELSKASPEKGRFILIHGVLHYPSGKTIEHAWVEDTKENEIYDTATKSRIPSSEFNNLVVKWRAHYQDPDLVIRLHEETGTWGPIQWLEKMGHDTSGYKRMGGEDGWQT